MQTRLHGIVEATRGLRSAKTGASPSTGWLVGVSSFWFATSYKWFLILVFLLPGQVAQIVPGGEKSAYWGAVFGTGAVWAIIGPALFGDYSDRVGDRRPFILAGSLLTVCSLFVLFHATAIWMLALGYLLLQISDDLATGPYSAVVPESVPRESRGRASGIMGVAMSSSQIVAVLAVLSIGTSRIGLYVSIGMLNVATALVSGGLLKRGTKRRRTEKSFISTWLSPWKHSDFRWVWLTRFLATLGFYLVIPYANYYVRDIVDTYELFGVHLGTAQNATAVLALTLAAAGALGAGATGSLVDRMGRKALTYAGAAVMSLGLAAMVSLPGMLFLWVFAIFVGAGYGIFQSANWAMVSDVLPEKQGLGRDMGIWQMSISSVQILAGGAGLLLTFGNEQKVGLGYQILFLLASVAVATGGYAARHVRSSQ